jgi:THO complex subunit 1 transcription elongation factor
MDYTLSDPDALWVQETIGKCMDELKQTTPSGRAFADTVGVILERERNWVRWKNELCTPFDKEPWGEFLDNGEGQGTRRVGLEEATRQKRVKMREDPEDWTWKLGTEPLTEIWQLGYRSLDDLRNLPQLGRPFSTFEFLS